MACIEIRGNKGHILQETNYLFLEGLDLELSYFIQGAEFSQAYLRKGWDGRKRLLSSNLSFPIGLLERVKNYYIKEHRPLSIVDKNTYSVPTPIDISKRLKELKKEPRYYQLDAVKVALEKKRGVIRYPTGSGKTLVIALIIAAFGKKSIVYVIGKDLLWQFHSLFESLFQTEIGMIGDGICEIRDINIASIWTVGKAFNVDKKKITVDDDESLAKEKDVSEQYYEDIRTLVHQSKVNIFDEVHLAAVDSVQKIFANACGEIEIGLSASPNREDKADLLIEAIFGKQIANISASELIEKGYLVKPVIKFLPVPKPSLMFESNYREIYKNYIVNNEERNNLIIRAATSLVEQDFVTLVLFREIAHGKILYDKLREKNIYFNLLDGSDDSKTRRAVVDEVISGKCKLLLSSSIFDIGIDLPCLSALVLAGAGKSSIRAVQRIGRVIRPYDNKDMAAIIDFHDNVKYLKDHYLIRKKIYESEKGFEVIDLKLK